MIWWLLAGALVSGVVFGLVAAVRLEHFVRAYGRCGGPPWERTPHWSGPR